MATRIGAGIFAGGLIPLVLAGLGDTYDMSERQVMIGRMLFAIISGQMLGSVVSGFANDAFGWHSALVIGAGVGAVAATVAWLAMPAGASAAASRDSGSFATLYGRVLANPKAPWLIGGVAVEGDVLLRPVPVHGRAAARDHGARPAARSPPSPASSSAPSASAACSTPSACASSCACSACAGCA